MEFYTFTMDYFLPRTIFAKGIVILYLIMDFNPLDDRCG